MERYEVRLRKPSLKRLEAKACKCTDVQLRTRYRIVVLSAEGWSRREIAAAVGWNVSSITGVRKRWLARGEAGLIDRREDNGPCQVTDHYAATLRIAPMPRRGPAFGSRSKYAPLSIQTSPRDALLALADLGLARPVMLGDDRFWRATSAGVAVSRLDAARE